jgi:hypothetical protein
MNRHSVLNASSDRFGSQCLQRPLWVDSGYTS